MTKNKKVLVIGGSGFLGSHVCDELYSEGYSIRIFDIVTSKYLNEEYEMIIGDISNKNELVNAISGCSYVYNFAGISDLDEAIRRPVETVTINILSNVNILQICKELKIERYIYASSMYVHSRDGGFYRCSKVACENYIEEYNNAYELKYTILRFGSLYGPRSNNSNGLYRIVEHSLKREKVKYEGNIESIREYIHVFDAAKASVEVLNEIFVNKILVLTGQEPIKVLDLLKMLSEILGYNSEVEFENKTYTGHYVRTPYSYKKNLAYKYIPPVHVDLGQGLIQLIEYISNQ